MEASRRLEGRQPRSGPDSHLCRHTPGRAFLGAGDHGDCPLLPGLHADIPQRSVALDRPEFSKVKVVEKVEEEEDRAECDDDRLRDLVSVHPGQSRPSSRPSVLYFGAISYMAVFMYYELLKYQAWGSVWPGVRRMSIQLAALMRDRIPKQILPAPKPMPPPSPPAGILSFQDQWQKSNKGREQEWDRIWETGASRVRVGARDASRT